MTTEINLKEARKELSQLLDRVEYGEEVIITRHGKKIARLVPNTQQKSPLPSLINFRKTIKQSGKTLSQVVMDGRKAEKF